MSSFTDLFKRVQVLSEAKVSPVGKQAPVFANVPKQMKAAGMSASSRDAMIFITQVLSRLDIITPEVYDMTVKGQHKERMEKLMTILRSKEEEINAKSDEIVEYINQNLDNYTSGAGADRGRTEKYKAVAKAMSQEVQNIKAGKEADDALRDIVKTADEDTVETLEFSAEDTTTIIEINTGNVANVEKVKAAVEEFANELGVEVTGNTVEFSVDEGSQIDQMVKKNGVAETEAFFTRAFAGDYPISVSIIPPAGAEEKEKVKAVTDAISSKPEGKIGREHVASVGAAADKFLKNRGLETEEPKEDNEFASATQQAAGDRLSAMYRKDMLAEIDKMHKSMVGDGTDLTTGSKFSEAEVADLYKQAAESNLSKYNRINKQSNGKQQDRVDVAQAIVDEYHQTQAANKGVEDAEHSQEVKVGSMLTTNYNEVVHVDEIDTESDVEGRPIYYCTDKDGGEHVLYPEEVLAVSPEDGEGKYDDNDGEEERCDYIPCEDGEDPEFKAAFNATEDIHGGNPGSGYEEYKEMIEKKLGRPCTDEECDYIKVALDSPNFANDEAELKQVAESKYTTADSLLDIYADVKPIVETVVESTTINENGQTTHTQQYLVEKREEAIEQVYTNQYLTEQKASDSLLVPKDEERQSFKERYQPKTSYQLEELRRYGL